MISRIKKGLTLLELVIAMALSTIVIGGATIVFLSMNRMSKAETQTYSELSDAKNLVVAIDRIINEPENKSVEIYLSGSAESVQHLLFSITDKSDVLSKYYFEDNKFEKLNTSTNIRETIYSPDTAITVSIDDANGFYRFTFNYGSNNSNELQLLKKI